MPDMERLTDQLAVNMACTNEQRMYKLCFISGKNKARLEVALIVVASIFIVTSMQLAISETKPF